MRGVRDFAELVFPTTPSDPALESAISSVSRPLRLLSLPLTCALPPLFFNFLSVVPFPLADFPLTRTLPSLCFLFNFLSYLLPPLTCTLPSLFPFLIFRPSFHFPYASTFV